MKTIKEILNLSTQYLEKYSIRSPRLNAEEIIAYVLGIKRIELYMDIERPLTEKELDQCRAFLKRKASGEPIDYIKGEKEFFDLHLALSPEVLIPRQETEIMVSKICDVLNKESTEGKVLWDLCTGSGCIALALKKAFPHLQVVGSDVSLEALKVAQGNAKKNNMEIEFKLGDLLAPFKGLKADYITCNPPYISEKDYLALEKEVKGFEPKTALVGGERGVEIYEKLEKELPNHLNSGGKVFFEIGFDQGEMLLQIFGSPFWKEKKVLKDFASHDRFFFLEIE